MSDSLMSATIILGLIFLPCFANASYDSARQAQQQAYADYFNAVSQLSSPTPDALKNLRNQILAPANQNFTSSQQQDYSAAHPTPAVPKGTNAQFSGDQKEKNRQWHLGRDKAIVAFFKKHKGSKGGSGKGGHAPVSTTTSDGPAPARPGTEVKGNFEKEIEFHHH